MLSRNSLTYAFIEGDSLWRDTKKAEVRKDCAGETTSKACRDFLAISPKATLQWRLEQAYRKFEAAVKARLR